MFEKAKPVRDAFTFSLGGLTTIASFTAAPAIADDRINELRDERSKRLRADRDRTPRVWFRTHHQPALGVCC